MGDWDEHQRQFINKLDRTEKLFNEIFEKDAHSLIINGENRNTLFDLRTRNDVILKKLKSKEFTVAVVGLEKAGKSTLGNALIKSLVLPEYAERCTYTTTEIRAGSVDEAVVSFYTRAEFNERFKDMFRAIEYPNEVDFATMRLDVFKKYWASVEGDESKKGLFNLHDGKTTEDIKAILEGRDELMPLLDQPDKKFGPDTWNTFDFKIFITGIAGKNADETVIRKPHPYAVKNVIIRSTRLGDMKNIVLYDVPGFDSPTELHKKQTEDMLIAADAIILVTDVGNRPNLTGPQLNMLRKGSDKYGVKLSEKAFVFGNIIDKALNLQTAKNNLNALRNDVVDKFKIADADHVLGGSARAYLEGLGLFEEVVAKKKLEEWDLPDGIDQLHHMMQHYYDHDRYAVLKKKAENTLKDAEKFLNDLLERYTPEVLDMLEDGGEYYLEAKDKLDYFIDQSNPLMKEHLKKIVADKPFSTALVDNIDKIYPLIEEAYEPLIEHRENELVIDPDEVYPSTTVDSRVRNDLKVEFIERIIAEVARLTEGRQAELRNELVQNFLKNMDMPANSLFREELEQSVNKLFDELLIDGGAHCYFNPLVERFTTTLMETIILSPFAEDERIQKIKLNLPEFLSLAVYYSSDNDKVNDQKLDVSDNTEERLKFFERMLTHESINHVVEPKKFSADARPSVDAEKNFKPLKIFFAQTNIDEGTIKKWSRQLAEAGIEVDYSFQSKLQRKVTDKIQSQGLDWNRLNAPQQLRVFDEIIGELCQSKAPEPNRKSFEQPPYQAGANQPSRRASGKNSLGQLDELYQRGRELKIMRSKEDMIKILDADIILLRDITVRAVVKAIGLEHAFVSVINKNVNGIRDALKTKPDGRKKFNNWIRNNIRKIKDTEFEEINRINQNSETRRQIVNSIRQTLEKM